MLKFDQFIEIKEAIQTLDEKQIIVGNGAKYGQIIFLAGGAGSGKGFAISHFLEGSKFKVRDVDEWKKAFIRLAKMKDSYPEIKDLDLTKPKDVFALHMFVKEKGIKDKTLDLMLGQAKEGRLPNIIFDVTMKDIDDITEVLPQLVSVGYNSKDIHIAWVLTNYHIAVRQNKDPRRGRIVPDDIMLKTHEGAANTMFSLLSGKMPYGVDGGVYVILGGAKHTIFHTDPKTGEPLDGRDGRFVVKDFKYLKMKDPGKRMRGEGEINQQVLNWIKGNIPRTKKTKEIHGSGRLKEEKGTELPEIYCDMDQVLCNFLKGTEEALGASYADKDYWMKDESGDKKELLAKKAPNLFRDLEWMPDGKKLYSFIKKHDPNILSAYPSWMKQGKSDKEKWLKRNTDISNSKMFLVKRHEKRNYAIHKDVPAILIDDHMKNIREWEQAGGIGIHHTSASKTIKKLKELGF